MSLPAAAIEFDGFLSLLTVIGLFPTVWSFYRKEKLNPIEEKFFLMTTWMSLFFLVRFPFQSFHVEALGGAVYTTAMILFFSTALYFETLLRRHYPLWFKIYLTVGSLTAIAVANMGLMHGNRTSLIGLAIFVTSSQLIVLALCWLRKRSDYTRVENSMIATSAWALLILGPFFLSDVSTYKLPLPKLGMIAALIFSYLSLFDQNLTRNRWFTIWNIFKSATVAFLLTLPFLVLIENREFWFWSRLYIAFWGLHLSIRIYMAVTQLDAETEMGRFLEVFNEADRSSLFKFLLSFRRFYRKVEIKIFRRDGLKNYDVGQIEEFMVMRDLCLLSRDHIRAYLERPGDLTTREQGILDQVIDLLESFEMTHLFKVGTEDVYFVLLCLPLVHYEKMIQMQAQAITETALLITQAQKR